MFIHIGNDTVIQSKDVIAIIDCNVISSSSITNEMVKHAKKQDKVMDDSTEESKSVVITSERIYFSSLSVSTLQKRTSMISTISKLDDYSEELD